MRNLASRFSAENFELWLQLDRKCQDNISYFGLCTLGVVINWAKELAIQNCQLKKVVQGDWDMNVYVTPNVQSQPGDVFN